MLAYLNFRRSFSLDPHKSTFGTAQVINFFAFIYCEVFRTDSWRFENMFDFCFFTTEYGLGSRADVEGDIRLVGLNTFYYSQTNIESEGIIR